MNRHLFSMIVACMVMPTTALAAETKLIRDAIACENIGIFALADNYYADGDDVAAKKIIKTEFARGRCTILKKGTAVIFYHSIYATDGDYSDKTTVHKKGEPRIWVLEKCALEGRDPALARLPNFVTPEKTVHGELIMKPILSALTSLLILTSCAPATYQHWSFSGPDGNVIIHVNGFTHTGETSANSSRKYIDEFLKDACPDGFKVLRLNEFSSHNAYGEFLYWDGEGRCKTGHAPGNQFPY